MPSSTIDSIPFTLYYDYDQIRDSKISRLTDDGKIEWFHLRMEIVFLEPLRRMIDPRSIAHKDLNSSTTDDIPRRTAVIATFSLLLNGIEALGSFLTPNASKNKDNFCKFIYEYMPTWNTTISGTRYSKARIALPTILWKYYRNGITHGFVIEKGGGIDYFITPKPWEVQAGGLLQINPVVFFEDFLKGLNHFFRDIRDPKLAKRALFLSRFREVYPH
jgi:hypothetical protein